MMGKQEAKLQSTVQAAHERPKKSQLTSHFMKALTVAQEGLVHLSQEGYSGSAQFADLTLCLKA